MKSRLLFLLAAVSMFLGACGGGTTEPESNDSQVTTPASDDGSVTDNGETDPGDSGDAGDGTDDSDSVTPEASGPLGENTIRIGDQTWERTLPMISGQCFLYEDDGTLPTSATAWGTLDGDDDLRFNVSHKQDGTFEAQISDNEAMFWGSGPSFEEEDLVIELDFEALTIRGKGTFFSLTTRERAMGSFQFTCEPEEE